MPAGVETPLARDESLVIAPSSRAARCVYGISIPGVFFLAAAQLFALARNAAFSDLPAIAITFLFGAALADLASASVHWACDTYGSSRTRWVGSGLIHSFRVHHRRPRQMLEHDALDVNGGACAAIFILLVAHTALFGFGSSTAGSGFVDSAAYRAGIVGFAIVAASANQLHAWAHHALAPRFVRTLQRRGLVLSNAAHTGHHRAPHTGGYCIALGWLNRPLDAVGFWRGLEHAIERVFGVAPRIEPGPAKVVHTRRDGLVRLQREESEVVELDATP